MRTIPAASGVVIDADARLLLILRTREPEAGRWTVPGGCVDAGESLEDAAVREVLEETGIRVAIRHELWALTQPAGPDAIYEIHDFLAVPLGGELRAGDDAGAARWFTADELVNAELSEDLLGYLRRAGILTGNGIRVPDPAPGIEAGTPETGATGLCQEEDEVRNNASYSSADGQHCARNVRRFR